jgi:hypothetical protein
MAGLEETVRVHMIDMYVQVQKERVKVQKDCNFIYNSCAQLRSISPYHSRVTFLQ